MKLIHCNARTAVVANVDGPYRAEVVKAPPHLMFGLDVYTHNGHFFEELFYDERSEEHLHAIYAPNEPAEMLISDVRVFMGYEGAWLLFRDLHGETIKQLDAPAGYRFSFLHNGATRYWCFNGGWRNTAECADRLDIFARCLYAVDPLHDVADRYGLALDPLNRFYHAYNLTVFLVPKPA